MIGWFWPWLLTLLCAIGALIAAFRASARAQKLEQQHRVLLGSMLRLEERLVGTAPMAAAMPVSPQEPPIAQAPVPVEPEQVPVEPELVPVELEPKPVAQVPTPVEPETVPTPPVPPSVAAAYTPPYVDERGFRFESAPDPAAAPVDLPPPVPPGPPPLQPITAPKPFDWERFFGVRLPIWLGAIALSFAGIFFVGYAIEAGLFRPEIRVLGGVILGAIFLAAAEFARSRNPGTDGPDIATALAAAAIVTLYASVYSATNFYNLVPTPVGLLGMGAVTVLSIVIAPRYGQILALVGLLGGYLTPLWFETTRPNAHVLFAYLIAVFAAFGVIMRVRNWWHLSPVALLGPVIWIIAWSFDPDLTAQHVSASAFLIGVPVIMLILSREAWQAEGPLWLTSGPIDRLSPPRLAGAWSVLLPSLGFPLLLLQSGFAFNFWIGISAFSVLIVVAGLVAPALRRLQLLALAGVLLALAASPDDPNLVRLTIGLGALFALSSLEQFRRLREPMLWSSVFSATLLTFFALLVFHALSWAEVLAEPHLFAGAALVLGAVSGGVLALFGPRIESLSERNGTSAALLTSATAFVSLALVIELDPTLFPIAAALAVLGLAIIYRWTRLSALPSIAGLLFAAYLLILFGSWLALAELQQYLPIQILNSPLLAIAVPGLAFVLAGGLFSEKGRTAALASVLDIAGVALLAWGMGDWLLVDTSGFWSTDAHRSVSPVFAPEAALALLAGFIGQRFGRQALAWAGLSLALLLVAAGIVVLALPVFTLWPRLDLGTPGLFNIALLSLGLPAALLLGAGWAVQRSDDPSLRLGGAIAAVGSVFLLFCFMLLEIRHAFHPELLQGPTSEVEHYAYSSGMLAFGIVLLVAGVALRNLGARILSLVFVLAATLKVFLYDASELEGLWRILSFLVMGVAFLTISWFYARFVFGFRSKAEPVDQPPPVPR